MQLLPALTSSPKVVAKEAPAGRHLPYSHHVDGHTIATRDGLLMQVIAMRGLLFETADTEEINYRKRLRDAMLQAIGSSRFALYHHIVRRRVDVGLDATFGDAFSAKLDAAWRGRLDRRQLFVNDLYLTLIRRPLQGRVGLLDGLREKLSRTSSPVETAAQEGNEALALRPDAGPRFEMHRRLDEMAPAMRDGFFLVPRLATHEDTSDAS